MDATLPLAVDGLSKAYRRKVVLRELSFALRPGEAVALLGQNGAGKSTLLGCLTGERLPDAGAMRLCGADPLSDLAAAARCMGSVPEQPFLYGELTVGEMLQFVAEARALPPEAAAETERLLELLGLDGAQRTLCRELSQGMARKVAIIAALLHEPQLLLLDEALNGLDAPSIARLVFELDRRRAGGAAVLLSSHDLSFVAGWCERGVLLGPGATWAELAGERWDAWRIRPTLTMSDTNIHT